MNLFHDGRAIKSPAVASVLFVVVVRNGKSPLREYDMYGANRKSNEKNFNKKLWKTSILSARRAPRSKYTGFVVIKQFVPSTGERVI